MNIDDLTLGQIKALNCMPGNQSSPQSSEGISSMVGEKCIIRTYSAGVWFGEISEKSGNEVIVKNARRLWRWQTVKSISLSAIAMGDISVNECKICEPVPSVWLEAIEVIPCSDGAIKTLEGAEIVKAS